MNLNDMLKEKKQEMDLENRKTGIEECLLEIGMQQENNTFTLSTLAGTNLHFKIIITECYRVEILRDYRNKYDDWTYGDNDLYKSIHIKNLDITDITDAFKELLENLLYY